MGNCLRTRRHEVGRFQHHQTEGPKDTFTSSCKDLVVYPLPLPPQHNSTYVQNLPSLNTRLGNERTLFPHLKSFTFYELKIATGYFCPNNLLRESGFDCTYKGWLNKETFIPAEPDPKVVVEVKALKPTGFQAHKQWLSEITYLSLLDHPNLVNLIGFCCGGKNRLLVYEFMPRGSLENHIFRRSEQLLSWELRIKVAVQAARGLSFLHASEPKVVYCDFKSLNIMLDRDYNAKLSDFGLEKGARMGDLSYETTEVMETEGYTAPEYLATGMLTTKCDVYSFGIMLLELITGRRAIDNKLCSEERKLLEWVRYQFGERKKVFRIMDIKLEGQYSQKEAILVASLALECCLPEVEYRPHMSYALSILEKIPLSRTNHQQKMSSLMSTINGDSLISGGHGSWVPME